MSTSISASNGTAVEAPRDPGRGHQEFKADVQRAREVATRLLEAYRTSGVFGIREGEMPENRPPDGVARGDERHLAILTLTVALDYVRDHDQLWDAANRSYADSKTSYLFDPLLAAAASHEQLVDHMKLHRLSLKPQKDPRIWRQISITLTEHFGGRVGKLIQAADRDALRLLELVTGPELRHGFPSLKGPKIRLLWARLLDDNLPGGLHRADLVDVPVDIHTAQATLQTGCVETQALGRISPRMRRAVQGVWRKAGVSLGYGFYPLAIEEPLWVLSRYGCRNNPKWPCQHQSRCPVADLCLTRRAWLSS